MLVMIAIAIVAFACASGGSGKLDIKTAEDWADKYPDIIASYNENKEDSSVYSYLEVHPYLKILYAGYGFSKDYNSARSHYYAVEDILSTQRTKPGASCLACKTSDYLELINENGDKAYAMKFEDVATADMPTISCYDCHKNEPGVISITRTHLTTAIEASGEKFNEKNMVCGQCHVEYYLEPETKEVILPWKNGLNVTEMIAYYDNIGYSDWEHPDTGTKMLKAQHPEFETFDGSFHSEVGLSCVDCHMPEIESESGEKFRSHHWTSPLTTIEESCLRCHGSSYTADKLIVKVEAIQKGADDRTEEVGQILATLVEKLKTEKDSGRLDVKVLDEARNYHRQAQFYWDFVFVENSSGFHDPKETHKNLDTAEELANKALNLLK
ncbi:MAG: ammonia-forming cytochrome c nitrite reductase subunit c552 [Eubacteriaceae bacterium]|nr:ammonia-forming cytochrome c nitrite reductase subunit c552 [Eubacteriaceae bacterium]